MRPGLETLLLKHMPELALVGVVPGAACAVLAEDSVVRMMALGFVVFWITMALTVAFGAFIVSVMKGPVHKADSYPVMPEELPRKKE